MPIVTLKLDGSEFQIECKEGEEDRLISSSKIIIEKLNNYKIEDGLSQSKKFLMISLILAEELLSRNNEIDSQSKYLKKISDDLVELERIVKNE
tara:strand:- start:425 stop:706 length:282 start_codon:yes stop_codon:yes gene_type:complete